MNNSWHNYPKVYALGHAAIKDIAIDANYLLVEEKVDGSQFSFGIFSGHLKCRSRNKDQDIEVPDSMFIKAIETVKSLAPLLHEGWTYRGEYLSKPKHNKITYERTPNKNIIIFDINVGQEQYLSYEDKKKECEKLGLEIVPRIGTIYTGTKGMSLETIEELLKTQSILGGTTVEGIVVKNYDKFTKEGKVMMGKFVCEKFKEMNQKEWKRGTGKDVVALIVNSYTTERRWEKAVERLKDNGDLVNEPKDIGFLVKAVENDIKEECKEEISEKLFNHFWNQIRRGVVRGLPEWYKKELIKNQ